MSTELPNDPPSALAALLGRTLQARGLRLATAESCTGGLIAAAVTGVAGSSEWFERGFVTYSNEAKVECLRVPASLIASHGAVSESVARAMADGARHVSQAELAVSVTGIAGPGGGTPQKPVGTVCFGWSGRLGTCTETKHFEGDREAVRLQATQHALQGLIQLASTLFNSKS